MATLTRRFFKADPDVPEDVDRDTDSVFSHFNDPNWDSSSHSSASGDIESIDNEKTEKSFYGTESEVDRSSLASSHGVQFKVQE
jgi:hypothetical protein